MADDKLELLRFRRGITCRRRQPCSRSQLTEDELLSVCVVGGGSRTKKAGGVFCNTPQNQVRTCDLPYAQDRSAQNFVQGATRSSWSKLAIPPPACFLEKHHQNTWRSRGTAPADLEPPQCLGVRVQGICCKGLYTLVSMGNR